MTTKPTEPDLVEQVEELLAKATPGPYALIAIEGDLRWRVVAVDGYGETRRLITVMPLESDWQNSRNNGLLFAAAPDLLRRLLDEVKMLRKANEELIDECGHWRAEAEHYAERPLEDF